jgi:hypothetical protein
MVDVSPVIINRFQPWEKVRCWCVCDAQKVPQDTTRPGPLKWIAERDKLLTLKELVSFAPKYDGYGLIVGERGDNMLRCMDLDHALINGVPKNENIVNFLESALTFVEISSSGAGLHLFFEYPVAFEEFGLRSDFCEGKFYPSRFIKLTGNIYQDHDYMIYHLIDREFENIRNVLVENMPRFAPRTLTPVASCGSSAAWHDILNEAGIMHFQSNYAGKERRGRIAIEAWKIQCPNRKKHSDHHRPGDFSADAAILVRWDDGSSSLTCNHNACKPEKRPNLLRLLWQEIKAPQIEEGNRLLKKMGAI